VDPIVIVVIIVVLTPLAVLWALAKSSQLRGPLFRRESRQRVNSLVTDVVPDEPPESDEADPPDSDTVDSKPPEPDPPQRD
jgi:hypothetical protein